MTKTGENELIKPFILLGLLFGWLNWLYVKSARKIAKNYQLIIASNQIFSCSLDYSSNWECSDQSRVNRPESPAWNLAFPLFISNIVSCVWKRVPDRFFVSGISLIWSSGFAILKQNRASFGIESMRASYNAEWTSGLRYSTKFWVWITGSEEPYWRPSRNTRTGQMGPSRSCPLGFFPVVPERKRSRFSHTRN